VARKLPKSYLGALGSEERNRMDTSLLTAGDLFFNKDTGVCESWNGEKWISNAGASIITGAYMGNGGTTEIVLGGPVQYVRIMRTKSIPSPGYLEYCEKFDVWYDIDNEEQIWMAYRSGERGLVCYVKVTDVKSEGILFTEDGFHVIGDTDELNKRDETYTFMAMFDAGRFDKTGQYHKPSVLK